MPAATCKRFMDGELSMKRIDPLEYAIAQLRHAYAQLAANGVKDQRQFADGLIAPSIRYLEIFAAR